MAGATIECTPLPCPPTRLLQPPTRQSYHAHTPYTTWPGRSGGGTPNLAALPGMVGIQGWPLGRGGGKTGKPKLGGQNCMLRTSAGHAQKYTKNKQNEGPRLQVKVNFRGPSFHSRGRFRGPRLTVSLPNALTSKLSPNTILSKTARPGVWKCLCVLVAGCEDVKAHLAKQHLRGCCRQKTHTCLPLQETISRQVQ